MLKVLQVVGTMNRGGAEVMLMDVLRNKPQDVHFDFLVNNPPKELEQSGVFDEEIISFGCRIRHIGTQLRIGPINYVRRFKEIFDELKPDVVHIHLNAKCGIIALAAHLAGCKKIITHCHADIRFRGSFLFRMLCEIEMMFQKCLIACYGTDWWGCSIEANRRLYWPWIRKHSLVINNSIDLQQFLSVKQDDVDDLRASYKLTNDTVILGNVGRIVPHKNIAFIIEVMNVLRQLDIDVAFVVAGRDDAPEYTNSIRKRAESYGIPCERLIFLGERDDVPVLMRTFDIFVGPALKEGFGLVAVEAQASGVFCVLYSGFPESVDMRIGLCKRLHTLDPIEWAKVISSSIKENVGLSSEEIALHIRANGFDVRENAEKLCSLYNNIK